MARGSHSRSRKELIRDPRDNESNEKGRDDERRNEPARSGAVFPVRIAEWSVYFWMGHERM